MQHTSCTEDRIQHALNRCLDGLRRSPAAAQSWSVGQSMNRWSLEELVKRDPENFLILLQQIIRKTREVQEQCQYELVAPLAIMFSSTLLQTPHCPPDAELLEDAIEVFWTFLTWPEPYCSVCKKLISTLQLETKCPGISFQRMVREEQGLNSSCQSPKTKTVLLMNPSEVPADFLSVAEQLSCIQHPQKETYITLIKHAFQSALGTKYPLHSIHTALQLDEYHLCLTALIMFIPSSDVLSTLLEDEMEELASNCPTEEEDVLDTDDDGVIVSEADMQAEFVEEDKEAVGNGEDSASAYRLPSVYSSSNRESTFSTISSLSICSKDSMFSSLTVASDLYAPSLFSITSGADSDFFDDFDECSSHIAENCSPKSAKASARLSQHLQRLFNKPKSPRLLYRAKSLGNSEVRDLLMVREHRSYSLPQQVKLQSLESLPLPQSQTLRHVCFRRRPILSSDEDCSSTTLKVVVFGADNVVGKVARAYSRLRKQETICPRLSKAFKLQFYFVPVRRHSSSESVSRRSSIGEQTGTSKEEGGVGDSTNDIAHLLGMLDPWYERNTFSLLNLPADVVCQQTSKTESESYDSSYEQRLPILADLILYYCRYAVRPALIQLYQAELTLACGEKRTEVFVHSLELGHTAGTRAVKAMGAASKRFGIDGEREAVPLTLSEIYSSFFQVAISGRNRWKKETKVCTSVTVTKACRNPEELDSKMEYLQLTMTEVLKRQNTKGKKGYNQVECTRRDKMQVGGVGNTTFAVCLDQDEKKILQSVTRCEITVCYKPDNSTDWKLRKSHPSAQIQPLHPTFCSLLCLPIITFSGALP
uniref:Phosphoinositide 3-kinase regulatory subunit 5 n=1 Tax=Gouania willdenowi TaxID=441366 RepID=A0A8C5DHB1_GOUWI